MKPAPKSIPEVSFYDFLKRAFEIVKNPLPFHHDNFEKKGNTFRLNLGFRKKVVFSRDAAFLQYVLQKNQKNYTKSEIQTQDLAKYIGRGLLTAEGEHWRKQRKLIQPSFHKKHLGKLLHNMQTTIKDELSTIPVNQEIDLESIFGNLAFQVVANSLFSSAIDKSQIHRLQEIVEASQKMLVKELRQPYLGWWFKGSGMLKNRLEEIQEARRIIREIITKRKSEAARKNDLLDLLLDAEYDDGTKMGEEQIIDEILILFTAGHETTSNALCFTAQLLARHPKYQELLRDENTNGSSVDIMERLMRHKITKHVLEEAMRLYPGVRQISVSYRKAVFFQENQWISNNVPLRFSRSIYQNGKPTPDVWKAVMIMSRLMRQ